MVQAAACARREGLRSRSIATIHFAALVGARNDV
jgi:hypothetical protein